MGTMSFCVEAAVHPEDVVRRVDVVPDPEAPGDDDKFQLPADRSAVTSVVPTWYNEGSATLAGGQSVLWSRLL